MLFLTEISKVRFEARVRGTPVKPLVKPFRQTVSRLLRQTISSNRSIKSKMFWKRRGLNSQPPAPQSNAITIRPFLAGMLKFVHAI